jgi:DNA polymerase-1
MKTLFLDTETTGLSPHLDRVTLVQYCTDADPKPVLIQDPDLPTFREFMSSFDRIVCHNCSFDFAMLGFIPSSIDQFEDTLYLDRCKNFRAESHALDAIATRILKSNPYQHLDKKRMQKTDWANAELTPEQRDYAALDAYLLTVLFEHLKGYTDFGPYKLDKRSILAGLRIQRHGLPVLRDLVTRDLKTTQTQLDQIREALPFNPNSPKQVCNALGLDSSSDKVLAELTENETAQAVRKARALSKHANFLKKLNAAPRYYGTLQPLAKSGRFTSKKENIQNLPRTTKKYIGTASAWIVAADFAQLELRTVAAIANDQTMIELFINGEDLHGYTAAQLFGPDYTKEQRTIAKVFNFATLYGAGAATIGSMLLAQTGIKLPQHDVQQLKNRWLQTYTGIAAWQQQGFTRHNLGLPHHTPHGRPYISQRVTDMLNIENQGAGAEVARVALHHIDNHLPDGARVINFIHDSYIIEATDDTYIEAARVVKEGMERGWRIAPFDKRGIPMPVEVGVARNLYDADNLENCIYTL